MRAELKHRLAQLSGQWQEVGLPARYEIEEAARDVLCWKTQSGIKSIWTHPPRMLTATLDDAVGQGLRLIHLVAEMAGLRVIPLGILQQPEAILRECHRYKPELLGLTVLRFTAADDLEYIGHNLPSRTKLIVGGTSIFQADPELAERTGVYFLAKDAAAFLRFLIDFDWVET